ncbi:MAG: hypothetical protein Tsb009_10300 [Planctomycetaceae bacterium]
MGKGMPLILLSMAIVFVGCSTVPAQHDFKLTENEREFEKFLLNRFPPGTEISQVENDMRRNGFECSHESDNIGDYLYCDKSQAKTLFVSVRWQIIIRYERGRTKTIDVNIGYIGL